MSTLAPESPPRPPEQRPEPDYAKRQASALAVLVLIALAAWGVASALSGGSHRSAHAAIASSPGQTRGHESLLDALAPDLQQSSGGTLTGNQVALPVGRAIAQLFMVGFAGTDSHAPFFARLRARDWGAIVLDSDNATSQAQVRALTKALDGTAAAAGHTPPLIAVRQVGGDQSQLAGLPPAAQPDQGHTPRAVAAQALAAGRVLRGLGVNTNLAPDADLGYQGGPADGTSFGTDPATVGRLSVAAVGGYRKAGVVAVLGHFPGQGAASGDPETTTASVGLTLGALQSSDLKPFAAAAASTPAIQISDALYAGLDPATPATLSPSSYTLLRSGLHYAGLVVSGDLAAAAADSGTSVGQAAVTALRAGADLLYVPGGAADQEQAYDAVLLALRQGQIPPRQIAAAVARVLALKRAYGLIRH